MIMKRIFILIFSILLVYAVNAQQREYSHWSMTLEVGGNMFDGDVNQSYDDIIPNSLIKTTYGATLQYTFNPVWGMRLEDN